MTQRRKWTAIPGLLALAIGAGVATLTQLGWGITAGTAAAGAGILVLNWIAQAPPAETAAET